MVKVKDFLNGFHSMNTKIEYIGIFDAQRKEIYAGEPVWIPTRCLDMEILHAEFTPDVNASIIVPAVLREVKDLDIF